MHSVRAPPCPPYDPLPALPLHISPSLRIRCRLFPPPHTPHTTDLPSSLPPPAQISLMEDQVQALNAREIKACFLGSAQSSAQVGTGEGYAQGSCAVGKSAAG